MDKAQFGLDTILSYFLFIVFLMFTLIALSLPGCGNRKIETGIDTDTGRVLELRMQQQLSAYLRTPLPDFPELSDRIRDLDGKGDLDMQIDIDRAVDFLEEHPEVRIGKTYGEFIVALYPHSDNDDARNAFDAATKALFHRHSFSKKSRELNEGRLDDLYYSPKISVLYDHWAGFYYGSEDLLSTPPLVASPTGKSVHKVLPTPDGKGVSVQFETYGEEEAKPLP